MLLNNKILLKDQFIKTYEVMTNIEAQYEIIQSKSGQPTLLLRHDGKTVGYHSRYEPLAEAEKFVDTIENLEEADHLLLIGVGLGYHLDAILERNPSLKVSIYEPNLQVLHAFLSNYDLSKLKNKNLKNIFHSLDEVAHLDRLLQLLTRNSIIATFPTAFRMNKKEIEQTITSVKQLLTERKMNLIVDTSFQMRWTQNAIINLPEVMASPNLFLHTKAAEYLKFTPVILVAAGPSLNLELESLRQIKESGTSYIFAVGAAVNTLIAHDIMPDGLFSYDPTAKNAAVVERIKQLQLPIPLLYGSSIGYEVLENYPGRKVHYFMSQDSITTNIIPQGKQFLIGDSPSVAVVALNILCQIGVPKVILVGQNLGLVNNCVYADGIDYADQTVDIENKSQYIETLDVHGNKMLTTSGYMQMKESLETVIASYNTQVINTTVGGAHIQGSEFIPLKMVMDTILVNGGIVINDIFEGENDYSLKQVKENYFQLEDSFDDMYRFYEKLVDIHANIVNDFEKGIIVHSERHFAQFDGYFMEIEKTPFFMRVIAPITRAQYKDLVARSSEVMSEKTPRKKMEKFIEIYTKYLRAMYVTMMQIQESFGQLKKSNFFKEGAK